MGVTRSNCKTRMLSPRCTNLSPVEQQSQQPLYTESSESAWQASACVKHPLRMGANRSFRKRRISGVTFTSGVLREIGDRHGSELFLTFVEMEIPQTGVTTEDGLGSVNRWEHNRNQG